MNREWKPGDVATSGGASRMFRTREGWRYVDGSTGGLHQDSYEFVRPLVVIDPEDREQVERLAKALRDGDRNLSVTSIPALQAALREFADPKPPKPDEPTGLGAVVRDDDGRLWIRVEPRLDTSIEYAAWRNRVPHADETVKSWANINAVEVLSEGVTS